MDDEIKCAPWNTSRAYVQVLTENNISFIMEIHWLLDSLRVQMIDQTFESADPVYQEAGACLGFLIHRQ